jgi:hypothetical protein
MGSRKKVFMLCWHHAGEDTCHYGPYVVQIMPQGIIHLSQTTPAESGWPTMSWTPSTCDKQLNLRMESNTT